MGDSRTGTPCQSKPAAVGGALKQEIRVSPAAQSDEIGWPEDGKKECIWSVSMHSMHYYEFCHSQGSKVVKHLLGESFERVLGSDFYASYNINQGLHQRCWGHLLRDGCDLKEQYSNDAAVQQWFRGFKTLKPCLTGNTRMLVPIQACL